MSDPPDGSPVDPSQIDKIDNPDALRMALRWALERLGALQKSNADLARSADWQIKMRAKSEETLKKQWEAESAYLQQNLANRQSQLETEYEARRLELENEHRLKSAEVERTRGGPGDAAALEAERASLERERAERIGALQEREGALREREEEFERSRRARTRAAEAREAEWRRQGRAGAPEDAEVLEATRASLERERAELTRGLDERARMLREREEEFEGFCRVQRESLGRDLERAREEERRAVAARTGELEASLSAGAQELESWRRRAVEAESREAELLQRDNRWRDLERAREEERRRLAAPGSDSGAGGAQGEVESWRRRALEAEARETEGRRRVEAPPLPSLALPPDPLPEVGWEAERTTLLDRLKRWKDAALRKAGAASELKKELAAARRRGTNAAPAAPGVAPEAAPCPPAKAARRPRMAPAAAALPPPAEPPSAKGEASPPVPVPASARAEPASPVVRLHDARSELVSALVQERRLAREAYFDALNAMTVFLRGPEAAGAVERLGEPLLGLLKLLKARNQALPALAAGAGAAEHYLPAHAVNVAVLSMNVGLGLRAGAGLLPAAGLAALLNDLSLMSVMGRGGRVPGSQDEPRLHALDAQSVPAFLGMAQRAVRLSLAQSGRGWAASHPREEDLSQAAGLVGLCELYETLSRPRPWRRALLPHEAVKNILETCAAGLDRGLLKAFLGRVTLYPAGSFVDLSTGEVAQVVEVHPEDSMSPTLEVCLKADGAPPEEPVLLRLSENPYVRIVKAVPEPGP